MPPVLIRVNSLNTEKRKVVINPYRVHSAMQTEQIEHQSIVIICQYLLFQKRPLIQNSLPTINKRDYSIKGNALKIHSFMNSKN